MKRALIVSPAKSGDILGNAVTADRWAGILERLGLHVQVAQEFDDQSADLLVALHARRSAPSIARFASERPGVPIVLALTGTDLYHDIQDDADAQASLELATRLVGLQESAGDALPEHLRDRLRVIYQSVDLPLTPDQVRVNTDGFQVCVMGHLRPVKDPLLTARAARLLPADSTVRIVHLGRALTPELGDDACAETEANDRYEWYGEVPREKALRVLAGSQLHVLTSRLEGAANVVSEAITLGIPTLSTRIDGSVGLLGAGYPGYFPVGDEHALARAMRKAETDPQFLDALWRAGSARAHLFLPEVELAAWRDLIEELPSAPRVTADDD